MIAVTRLSAAWFFPTTFSNDSGYYRAVMDPKETLASPDTLGRVEALCRRRCRGENEADECYLFVLEGLQADDYARLRKFEGKSRPATYIHSCVHALISDFLRNRYGRKRIPGAVAGLGTWAEAVYEMICWKKRSLEAAYDLVALKGLFNGSIEEFYSRAEPVRKAPCPENPNFISMNGGEDGPGTEPADTDRPNPLESLLEKLDHQRRTRAARIIREVTDRLSEPDQLLVRLVFASDHSVAAAARAMGLDPRAANKRLKKLLTRFREKLLAEGIREP